MDNNELAEAFGAQIAFQLRDRIDLWSKNTILFREDSCYESDNGFWTAVVILLTGWRDQFPVVTEEVKALLAAFDAGYKPERLESADILHIAGLTRFGSQTIASLRKKIAELAAGSTPSAMWQDPSEPKRSRDESGHLDRQE